MAKSSWHREVGLLTREDMKNELMNKKGPVIQCSGGKKIPGRQSRSTKALREEWDLKSRPLNHKNSQEMGSGEVRKLRTSKSTSIFYPILVKLRIIEELTYRKSYSQSPISKILLWLYRRKGFNWQWEVDRSCDIC